MSGIATKGKNGNAISKNGNKNEGKLNEDFQNFI